MLKQAQQFALWRSAEAKSVTAAFEALKGLDPLARLVVRRRLWRIIKRADIETTSSDLRHRYLLAYLLGAGATPADADDVEAVEAQALAIAPPSGVGTRVPWLSLSVLGLLLALGGAGYGIREWLRPFSPVATPVGDLLGRKLSAHVVSLVNGDTEGARRTGAELRATAPLVLGEPAARELGSVMTHMDQLVKSSGPPEPELVSAYERSVVRLDAALASSGQPFYLDAELRAFRDRTQPVLMSYYVQGEARVAGTSPSIRVVRLWRLDDLNISQGLVGFTRPGIDAAIVLLDQAEEALVRVTLPAAAPNGRVELVDDDTRVRGGPWVAEVEEAATKVTLAYYQSLGEPRTTEAMRLGTLLLRRRNLVRKWQGLLTGMGLQLNVPRRLFPDVDYAKELWLKIPRDDLADWREIQDELRERLPAFEALREGFVQSVEQHEVQHSLDFARGSLEVPDFLCQMTACDDRRASGATFAGRARDEASAYLAEIARTPGSARAELVVLSAFVLDQEQLNQSAAYGYAVTSVYVAIARALGIDVEAVLGRGTIRRERVAKLALLVWSKSDAELRAAARRAYLAEFKYELPEVKLEGRKEHARYRP
jgi:hypothetical protein